jgi:hypothetical protein
MGKEGVVVGVFQTLVQMLKISPPIMAILEESKPDFPSRN